MSPHLMRQQQHAAPVQDFEQNMLNVVHNFCAIVTMPVELALRPFHGTRYFTPTTMIMSAIMMIFLPLLFGFAGAVGSLNPFAAARPTPIGLIGMWGFSRLFFLGLAIHGVRKWRLMLRMQREQYSVYEGEPLFFFHWLPHSTFWKVRILYEPLFLIALSIVLPNYYIVEPGLATFLFVSGMFLAFKGYVDWYIQWQFIRESMDIGYAGPIIAAFVQDKATDEDLNKIHLASLPKDMPDEDRVHIAKNIKARVLGERD